MRQEEPKVSSSPLCQGSLNKISLLHFHIILPEYEHVGTRKPCYYFENFSMFRDVRKVLTHTRVKSLNRTHLLNACKHADRIDNMHHGIRRGYSKVFIFRAGPCTGKINMLKQGNRQKPSTGRQPKR